MKRHLNIIAYVIAIAALTTSCESYEKRMEKLEKVATEYKATLGNNVTVLAEVIDSTAQEIIYMKWVNVEDSWDFVDKKMDRYGIIETHNYVTGTTENTMANWPKKDDYNYFGDFHLIKDRLFLNLWDGRYVTAVIYLNLRDNSIHEVAFPEGAEITDNQISLTEMYVVHDAEYMCNVEYGRKKYVIKTSLTDAEYEAEAKRRSEDIQSIERKAQEEDRRHRQIVKKEGGGFGDVIELRMSGLIGNVSAYFGCHYDNLGGKWDGGAGLDFIMNDEVAESWGGEITSLSDESGRMVVLLENGTKGELIGYVHGGAANSTYEGTYYDPYGNETPFKFFDDFRYWGF